MTRISIIIPVLNERANLEALLPYLNAAADDPSWFEVLVCDGGSTDGGAEVARCHGASFLSSAPGRARQMNAGALEARGEVLYFLHADSRPPQGFDKMILKAHDRGKGAGCFRLAFDSPNLVLRAFAWFTRLNWPLCRGGDQSLFIRKAWFEALGGFNERFIIYEDNEFTGRIYDRFAFTVLPAVVKTSARRYADHGVLTLQFHYTVIHLKRWLGAPPEALYRYYRKFIGT
ncbi:TIGR04283 family arsenosugar biosynthesis glycosyltransferase [Robiginitalea sediminis]|uniref:TIGR04283 family arsenosugar biosynthesis glycosyltransferase n=1 Tax=Robiginitalea sediminis TaxID=1982593 RepID=UPI000B4A862C|nr:TIGR04283 family arsenosugar biosynthesis glycosyltransferase [Robiginitalea sediminis]